MKMTLEQIAALAPKAAHIRVVGEGMYGIDWCDPASMMLAYSNDDGEVWEITYDRLVGDDITFYELKEMVPPDVTQAQTIPRRGAGRVRL